MPDEKIVLQVSAVNHKSLGDGTRLSSSITIRKYRDMEKAKDTKGIAAFIQERLSERYILPVRTGSKNGFAMMACACLLIETLESFWNGWKTSDGAGPGENAFRSFFARNTQLREFERHADSFYRNVRSGILHQGETKGGWRISRTTQLPVLSTTRVRTIQAAKFLSCVEGSLCDYCRELESEKWESQRWRNARRKVNHIIENCQEKI